MNRALAQLLTTAPVDDPPTAGQRRLLVTGFTDLFLAHRGTLRLLTNDISARLQLGLGTNGSCHPNSSSTCSSAETQTAGPASGWPQRIGALVQPVSCTWIDSDNATTRTELIETAVGRVPSSAFENLQYPLQKA